MKIPSIPYSYSLASFFLRLFLGCVIFAHGSQKMFGWFGGHGYNWTINAWKQWFGFPEALIHIIIWAEIISPLLILVGLFSRYAAGVVIVIMLGAIVYVHGQWGFFMNWYMVPHVGEGYEFHILVIGMSIGIAVLGDGKLSLAHYMISQKEKRK